jgi:hypothetical protein
MSKANSLVVALALVAWSGAARGQEQTELSADPGRPELDVDTDLPIGPLLLGSFGLTMVAVGAGFGWQADQEYEDWDEARKAGDPLGEMDGLADDVKAHSIAANVLMFGGAGVAAVSVIWLLLSGGDDEEEGQGAVAWRPAVGAGRAGLLVQF